MSNGDLQPRLGQMVTRWDKPAHGPFDTATDYYSAKARVRWDTVKTQLSETVIDAIKHANTWHDINGSERAALIAWLHIQAAPLAVIPELDTGPFLLQHADLTPANIMVDDDFNITGILDWTWACTVPQQSFTVFHAPLSSRVNFLPPSNVAEAEARDKKQLIDDVKRFEDPLVSISDVWLSRQAAIAACFDPVPAHEEICAAELAALVYGDEKLVGLLSLSSRK